MDINRRLKALRERSGLTLEEVAKKIKVTKQTVQKYESGIVVGIPSDRIEALAEVYEVSPGYIMGWEEPRQPKESPKLAILFKRTRVLSEKQLDIILSMVDEMADEND